MKFLEIFDVSSKVYQRNKIVFLVDISSCYTRQILMIGLISYFCKFGDWYTSANSNLSIELVMELSLRVFLILRYYLVGFADLYDYDSN